MARILKYPTNCYQCGKLCDPKEEKRMMRKDPNFKFSFLTRRDGKWMAHCYPCYELKKDKEKKNVL